MLHFHTYTSKHKYIFACEISEWKKKTKNENIHSSEAFEKISLLLTIYTDWRDYFSIFMQAVI